MTTSQAADIRAIWIETLLDVYESIRMVKGTRAYRKGDFSADIKRLESFLREHSDSEFFTVILPQWGEIVDRLIRDKLGEGSSSDAVLTPFRAWLRPIRSFIAALSADSFDANQANTVRLIRTLFFGFKKLELPYTPKQVEDRLNNYLAIEEELPDPGNIPDLRVLDVARVLELLFRGYSPRNDRPQHGPGAVAGGEKGTEKWQFATKYESLHACWPYYENIFLPIFSGGHVTTCERPRDLTPMSAKRWHLARQAGQYRGLKPASFPVSRLLFVPKDSRGPRTISCEPMELMYVQQGVSRHLVRFLEERSPLRGHIHFHDQSINASKALTSSLTRGAATIDLSDASDRVSLNLCHWALPPSCDKLFGLRSHATILPGGRQIFLKKFAPMGSALCFPMESVIFFGICVACIARVCFDSCDDDHVRQACEGVYIYGDDLIVPDEFYASIVEWLELFSLKVNQGKSFHGKDPFRESCGTDALLGREVTPHRIKLLPPSSPTDGTTLQAYCRGSSNCWSFSNKRAQIMRKMVSNAVRRRIPLVPYETGFLSVVVPTLDSLLLNAEFPKAVRGLNGYYQSKELVLINKPISEELDASWRLQMDLVQSARDPSLVVERQSTQIRHMMTDVYCMDGGQAG